MLERWVVSGLGTVLAFQAVGDALRFPMEAFSALGVEIFYLLVMPALLWCYDVRLGARVGLILMISSGFNSAIKMALGLPRPFWLDPRVGTFSTEASFGFPSGHAQNAVAVWGRLAAYLKGRAWLGAAVLIGLISVSRVYLGMHFPASVLGGWAVGGLTLAAFLLLEGRVERWIAGLSKIPRYLVPVLASGGLLLLNFALARSSGEPLNPSWSATAAAAQPIPVQIAPLDPQGYVSVAGVLLGFGLGLLLLADWGRFSSAGTARQRLLRFLLGSLGAAGLFIGLDSLLPQGGSWIALAARYLRYAAVGLWVSYGAPRLFFRLGLAGA